MKKYEYDYEQPSITADCIVIYNDKILLVKRKNDPYKDILALPGGYFDVKHDDSILAAANRELKEETGLNIWPDFFRYYDEKHRDPRSRVVTFVFTYEFPNYGHQNKVPKISAGDDALDVAWHNIENLWYYNLAFDHKNILKDYFQVKIRK